MPDEDLLRSADPVGASAREALSLCLVGPASRPPTAHPVWLTITVVALARLISETGDFAPLPVLADALQEAGCDNADILAHCRGYGPHVQGCWVVGLLLGGA